MNQLAGDIAVPTKISDVFVSNGVIMASSQTVGHAVSMSALIGQHAYLPGATTVANAPDLEFNSGFFRSISLSPELEATLARELVVTYNSNVSGSDLTLTIPGELAATFGIEFTSTLTDPFQALPIRPSITGDKALFVIPVSTPTGFSRFFRRACPW